MVSETKQKGEEEEKKKQRLYSEFNISHTPNLEWNIFFE